VGSGWERHPGDGVQSGPVWSPAVPPDCVIDPGDVANAGDHEGPPRIHPTTLAPTESWMCALG